MLWVRLRFNFAERVKLVGVADHEGDAGRPRRIGPLDLLIVGVFEVVVDELGFDYANSTQFQCVLCLDHGPDVESGTWDFGQGGAIVRVRSFV